MGYRTVKRALGETNLEKKCRILFGVCLAVLIAAAFVWVEYNAEKVVLEATRTEGRNLVTNYLLRNHWLYWDNNPNADQQQVILAIIKNFTKGRNYKTEYLALERDQVADKSIIPTQPEELLLLRELREEFERQLREEQVTLEGDEAESSAGVPVETQPRFKERSLPELDEYHYYEPVYWKPDCTKICHIPLGTEPFARSASGLAGSGLAGSTEYPFRVVKVVIPYERTKQAIAKARAALIAAAIATVFMAMVALYLIVRYVIVKPLKHLRDVSDEISRGNTELRAEINTNDEFEELADSFNRMLRHLIETQAELRHVNSDLDAKVDELAQLNMRLYEMNRLKSDFLANMSHELRTPLNSIIGFSEVLQGIESLTDKQRRYAKNIQKSGRVLLEMINDILDLAKLEAGKMEVRPSEFRIDAVVASQCDMVRSLTEQKNIDLEVHATPQPTLIYQDQSKVQQILTNLLSNAIKFTPEGGRITVTARHLPEDLLELTVADTGVGIPEEDREVIFEKFRQSKSVLGDDGLTREHSGTGLGLSIVRELCSLLHGEISFESELGRGSTFRVLLPWNLTGSATKQLESRQDQLTWSSQALTKT